MRLLVAAGAPRWVQLSATSVTESEGQRTLRIVLVDVTERRKADAAEAALRVAEQTRRQRDELLSRVSHEFRTPLNAILGFSSMLLMAEQTRAQPAVSKQLQHIHDAGTHLLQMVVDVLDMSRLTGGSLSLQLATIDPRELLRSAVREVEADAGSRGITIQLDMPEPGLSVAVRADPTRLKQVLLNLLSNAVKYNRANGHVNARLTCAGGHWRMAIADDGIGMSAPQLSALFKPFDRLGRESQGFNGTGLGLVIARELVERMGGVLTVRSEVAGGSEFAFELAAGQTEDAVAVPAAATAAAPESELQLRTDITGRVLCVEDDDRARQLMDLVLARRPGITLELVATGREGMAAARRAWPDLLILDQGLPDMAGLDLLRVLKQLNPHLPMACIVASAEAAPASLVRARAAGADEYLVKPIDPGQLLSLVDKMLTGRRSRH